MSFAAALAAWVLAVQGPVLIEGAPAQGALVRGQAQGAVSLVLDGESVPIAPDGAFLLGFDRDAGPTQHLRVVYRDGRTEERTLAIAPSAWRIEHVNVARRPGGASEEFLRRRRGELERIAEARGGRAETDGWRQPFLRPAPGRISGRFGAQRVYRGEPAAYHSGVDIAGGAGTAVVAPADGVVTLAPPPIFSLEGNLVVVDHGMGLHSAFLHLATVDVREGERVRRGQPIGTVGSTGRATGPHLHWSLTWNGARIDPLPLIGD